MRKILAVIAVLGVGVLAINAMTPAPPPLPSETFGDRAKRICAVEAGKSKRDQDDCVTMKLMGKAFELHSADYDKRLRDASR